jgi:hypothetical protein
MDASLDKLCTAVKKGDNASLKVLIPAVPVSERENLRVDIDMVWRNGRIYGVRSRAQE